MLTTMKTTTTHTVRKWVVKNNSDINNDNDSDDAYNCNHNDVDTTNDLKRVSLTVSL